MVMLIGQLRLCTVSAPIVTLGSLNLRQPGSERDARPVALHARRIGYADHWCSSLAISVSHRGRFGTPLENRPPRYDVLLGPGCAEYTGANMTTDIEVPVRSKLCDLRWSPVPSGDLWHPDNCGQDYCPLLVTGYNELPSILPLQTLLQAYIFSLLLMSLLPLQNTLLRFLLGTVITLQTRFTEIQLNLRWRIRYERTCRTWTCNTREALLPPVS
ncbi:hypothetical protein C8Q72DRAFT_7298 [Fomitopsis betulina]|nr:hypothetical protein C8Q72DRAFT_7298 [Fomitopsis betulina]